MATYIESKGRVVQEIGTAERILPAGSIIQENEVLTVLVPTTGTVTYTGKVPTIRQVAENLITPVTGSVSYSGNIPAIVQSAETVLEPITGQVTYAGNVPTVIIPPSDQYLFFFGG